MHPDFVYTTIIMAKAAPTKTTNPIHFEDLDPKRFEDLVRELIYDFKDWQSIEATGKGGSDDGYDVRAFERLGQMTITEDGDETIHPMDGNLWMIQCKREKQIGPTDIKKILEDVDTKNPPYGYILAAAANFSKKAYDTLHSELRAKGVMEFYLWGKAELETMLYLPKNDRVLFTFFGISNVSRRRSRATEIRFGVVNKNRIMRAFGDSPNLGRILVRDSKDSKYPYMNGYPDFETRPRWREYKVVEYHPLGLVVEVQHNYAFYDKASGTFDVAEIGSLIFRESDSDEKKQKQHEDNVLVKNYWENLSRRQQAMFQSYGLIRYDAMLVIDDKGDTWNSFPHVFVDFVSEKGPFEGRYEFIKVRHEQIHLTDLTKKKTFPTRFPKKKFGKIHKEKSLPLLREFAEKFLNYESTFDVIYDCKGLFDHLAESDVALVHLDGKDDAYLQVTHRFETTVDALQTDGPHSTWQIERQVGFKPEAASKVCVIEFRRAYEREFAAKDN